MFEFKEAAALKDHVDAVLEKARSDRAHAKVALAIAKTLREKEAAAVAAMIG